jgi:hypothetical protein
MRQSWTDERLDDFREHVDQRFDQVDQRFDQVDQRFERIEAELRMQRTEINEGFRALHRATLQIGAGIFGTLMLAILTMLSTQT